MTIEEPRRQETNDKRTFKMEESFRTDIDLVDSIDETFRQRLVAFGWDKEDAIDMSVGFHEALVNAIAHGNLGITKPEGSTEDIGMIAKRVQTAHPSDKKIYITTEITKDKVSVTIRDEGAGYEPKKVADPTDPEHLFKAEGRGLLFMKAYFDEITYNKERKEVTLVKKRK